MNNSNPFVPQGSLLEQQSKRRSRMKLGVFCVLTVSVAGLVAMLIQGCKREPVEPVENTTPQPETTNPPFAMDTNPPIVETSNPPPLPPPVAVTPAPTPAPTVEPTGTEYVVVKGDYFEKIAKKFGVSTKAVMAANPGVEPTKLKVGQKLMIPAPSSSSTTAPGTTTTSNGMGGEIYVVKSGDTLTKIAKAYGTTIKAIESENNLTTTKIKVGQKLKIPAKAESAAPASVPASQMITPLPPSSSSAQ